MGTRQSKNSTGRKATEAKTGTATPNTISKATPPSAPAPTPAETTVPTSSVVDVRDLSVAELRLLLTEAKTREAPAKAAAKGQAKLAKLRTYAVRQRAWAESQTAKASTACDRADKAEAALATYEAKLGIDPATEAEIAATLAALIASGRVVQVDSSSLVGPEPEGTEAETAVADVETAKTDDKADSAAA